MSLLIQRTTCHASENTIYHALYGYYFLKINKLKLAKIYNKNPKTISRWIDRYKKYGYYSKVNRKSRKEYMKFKEDHHDWIIKLYQEHPLFYLNEAKLHFQTRFNLSISVSTICRILAEHGYTWKTIERRAIQIKNSEIINFMNEISSFPWNLNSLLFLDEVAFDNRGMLRKRGYAIKGNKLYHRGEFVRQPRVSLLCFLHQEGIMEAFETQGTFDRIKFFDFCRSLVLSGKVEAYPGKGSVWIMDGARIHCDKHITKYLRSVGIVLIFLPSYTPFFNPIELVFGYLKKYLQKLDYESSKKTIEVCIAEGILYFTRFNATKIMYKCGYHSNGSFNPNIALDQPLQLFDFDV